MLYLLKVQKKEIQRKMEGGGNMTADDKMDLILKKLDTMDKRLESVEVNMAAMGKRMESMEENMEAMDKRLESVEENMETMGKRMESMDIRMENADKRTGAAEHRLDALETKVDRNYAMLEEFYVCQKEFNNQIKDRMKIFEGESMMYHLQIARNTADIRDLQRTA